MSLPNRRPCITQDAGSFAISVSYDPRTGHACEVFMTKRARSGSELEEQQYEMGVIASKLIQGEDL